MANKEITNLPAAGVLVGTEEVPIQKGAATLKTTVTAIAAKAPIQDHNSLLNLNVGDVHTQYLTPARGDVRYPPLSRLITAGNGISGGGDLNSDRTITAKATIGEGIVITLNGIELDINGLGLLPEAVDSSLDMLVLYNASEGRERKVSVATAFAGASGSVPLGRQVISGAGLTGGGDLSADRTLAVGAGSGITVNADDVALDTASGRNVDHNAVSISPGTGLTGGGTITTTRALALDTASTRNTDHATVTVTGTNSVIGGGDLTAARTLQLSGDVASPGNNFRYGTSGAGVKGWFQDSFATITGLISNAQIAVGSVTQYQSSLSIAWSQLTGTKNADQVLGFVPSSAVVINTVVARDSAGDIFARYINANSVNSELATPVQFLVTNGVDTYCRKSSVAQVQSVLGIGAGTFSGATVFKGANASIADNTLTILTFDQEELDVGGWHNTVSNTSRLTVPAGVTYVRLTGRATFDLADGTAYADIILNLLKNGAIYKQSFGSTQDGSGQNQTSLHIDSGPVQVIAGDFFELQVLADAIASAPNYTVPSLNQRAMFAVERLG